jgi:divalent metal cation (Fe/Co/Zn/Cd) transporter
VSGVPVAGVAPARDAAWLARARRARQFSWLTLAWLGVEGATAMLAGILANSIALIGFGIDSAIEAIASIIVVWRFTGQRTLSETAERRAQKLVAISFFLLAPYIAVESIRTLINSDHASTSYLGIALTIGSVITMIPLGLAKHRLGKQLDSRATAGEGTQNLLCAYLAIAVLVGLLANTLFSVWWLDPIAGLLIAAVAIQEGREAWEGEEDEDDD